jgi:PBP superfamily domain
MEAQGTTLRVIQIATDPLEIGYNTNTTGTGNAVGTNMPTAGLSIAQLVKIYSCTATTWAAAGAGSSTATIIPLIPQAGSGTRSTFLTDLGNPTNVPGSCVQTVEENDPTAITNATTQGTTPVGDAKDAIVPFSAGRLALYTSGYFHDPSVAFPGGASLSPNIALQNGCTGGTGNANDTCAAGTTHRTSSDGTNQVYDDVRGLYIVFRNSDSTSPTGFDGSALNWAQSLFIGASGVTPYVNSFGKADITAAGVIPTYADLGHTTSG